jgi:hypothetical protein
MKSIIQWIGVVLLSTVCLVVQITEVKATPHEKRVSASHLVAFLIFKQDVNPITAVESVMNIMPSQAINIVVAGILAAPNRTSNIVTTVLKKMNKISLDDFTNIGLAAMLIVPELNKEIVKAMSVFNHQVAKKTDFLKTTTFKNGFYGNERFASFRYFSGGGFIDESELEGSLREINERLVPTTTGGQISVSPSQ